MIIALPLYLFLFIYFGFLAIFVLFVVINFYHIVSSGVLTVVNFVVTVLIAAVTVFALFGTYQLLKDTDWKQSVTIFDSSWITNTFPESSL